MMDPTSKAHLDKVKRATNIADIIGIGIHGDGVPCNWDRSESIEVISINLPGVPGKYKNMLIPLFTLFKSMMSEHTYDDLMDVLAWSFRCSLHGFFPTTRHDGHSWLETDRSRQRQQGKPLEARGAVCERRGDWKFFAEDFHLPLWKENAGICWSCNCTADEVGDSIRSFNNFLLKEYACICASNMCRSDNVQQGTSLPIRCAMCNKI